MDYVTAGNYNKSADTTNQDLLDYFECYRKRGWHVARLVTYDYTDITKWNDINLKSNWLVFGFVWLFESADDATMFKLRWV